MINNANDVGFIHDIASLDQLRQQAVNGDSGDEKSALNAAAKQFESIFTSMLFKSMRDANASFESGVFDSQNQQFYRQMLDDQMSSELSASGSLGLADMIVKQLSTSLGDSSNTSESQLSEAEIRTSSFNLPDRSPISPLSTQLSTKPQAVGNDESIARVTSNGNQAQNSVDLPSMDSSPSSVFATPSEFVDFVKPYANQAASTLGVEPSLLIAQAALETGWGKKVIQNSNGSSNNLFNIKADRSWQGDKVATQTLEYHNNIAVNEKAAFRKYGDFEESFNDYVQFLNENPRYQNTLNNANSSEEFIRGIHKAGYATDPQYADKVMRVKNTIDQM
jgi:flagellar protein FlgJ